MKKETLAQAFSSEFCQNFKNTSFYSAYPVADFVSQTVINKQYLLSIGSYYQPSCNLFHDISKQFNSFPPAFQTNDPRNPFLSSIVLEDTTRGILKTMLI